MDVTPDFWLSAPHENVDLQTPHACWVRGRLADPVRDDHLLVEVRPGIAGQKYGEGGKTITHLILSSKYVGDSLVSIQQWPLYVYVSRIIDDTVLATLHFNAAQIELIAWGRIDRVPH